MTDKPTSPPFIIVDGSSYLFRAYYALPALSNAEGQPTGAMYGVLNMLKKLLDTYKSTHIAVVFDPKGKTTRHHIDPNYKANRAAMPEQLGTQIQPLHTMIKAMGLPLVIIDGIEADDIIGTLAHQATMKNIPVMISTGDKDMAQLVDKNVTLVNTMTDTVLDSAGVAEKFGVPPERIIDYLALIGDSVDNIPGLPGVGPKTAAKWINQYGSLDTIIASAGQIKGKAGEKIASHLDQLALAKRLLTIQCDIQLPCQLEDLQCQAPDRPTLETYFKRFGFRRWLTALPTFDPSNNEKEDNAASTKTAAANAPNTTLYETVLTDTALDKWLADIKQTGAFAFDVETTSLNPFKAELVGISLSMQAGKAAYIPFAHNYDNAPQQLNREAVLARLKPLLEDPSLKVIGQNLKYDISIMQKYGVTITHPYDTMLASYVLNSTATRHSLDRLALYYLHKTTLSFEEVAGKGKKQRTFNEIPLDQATAYAAEDADIAWQLYEELSSKLKAEPTLQTVLEQLELPLIPILVAMETRGVLIDSHELKQQSQQLGERLQALEAQIIDLAGGHAFNLNSPKQLQAILFDQLKLPVIKKTPKGQPSTSESVLQTLSLDYPLPKLILAYRTLSKLKSTYTDPLPEQVNPTTGRVHCSYNQAVAGTGRLSSTTPNLQNIPVRTEEGQSIRKAFIAPSGFKLLTADYSQVELRIMAQISKDKKLCSAFAEGLDIHQATAAQVFNVPIDEVSSAQRRQAKAINFGLIYGMSAFGLAKQLGIARDTAQHYIDCYFERYPGVLAYMERAREQAHQQGFVETLYGRRLYLPDINAQNFQQRQAAERAAINGPMQGSSADIIKFAMINIDQWLKEAGLPCYLIMQVHDELIFEVAEEAIKTVAPAIRWRMTEAWQENQAFQIPLTVDIKLGTSWGAAEKLIKKM